MVDETSVREETILETGDRISRLEELLKEEESTSADDGPTDDTKDEEILESDKEVKEEDETLAELKSSRVGTLEGTSSGLEGAAEDTEDTKAEDREAEDREAEDTEEEDAAVEDTAVEYRDNFREELSAKLEEGLVSELRNEISIEGE